MNRLDAAITLAGMFEAELLVELMLRYWRHPRAADPEYRNHLLELAADMLNRSRCGEEVIDGVPPEEMSFVAAIWYAEACQIEDCHEPDNKDRQTWLETIRRALPSCFCPPQDLL